MRICQALDLLFLVFSVGDGWSRADEELRMQITELRIRKVEGGGKLRAYVTVTFDDCFVVHNVKVIEGKTGPFIAMPSRKTSSGEYKDVDHPISPDFRNALQDKILSEYTAGHFDEFSSTEDED